MSNRLALFLSVFALAAVAGTVPKVTVYQITLVRPAVVAGSTLAPGEYKLLVRDAKATLTPRNGGPAVEAPVKVETVASKFDTTTITYQKDGNGKAVISEIDLGGSKTTLMFAQ